MAKKRNYPEIELTPERIADVIYKANKPVRLDDILAMLKVKRNRKRDVEFLLHALELDGRLIRSRGTWFPPKNRPLVQGVLSIQRNGAGFVIPEASDKGDVFIAPQDLKDAWDGDIVEVAIMPHRQGPSREGRITRIVDRSQKLLPAFATRKQGNEWLATPQHSGLQVLFRVDISEVDRKKTTPIQPTYAAPDDEGNMILQGQSPVTADDLLLIMPLEKLGPGLWSAKAVMNLYNEESPAAQELLAKIGHGIPMEFPPAVIKEVALMPENPRIDEGLLAQRKDLRDIAFVTIDGADAKDFDDAIYAEKTAKGYRLLVAIADVSYYVTNASAIDNEARRRGNSYYFPLSVEPMLPEVLSNGLCSLQPHVPRLAVVAEMFFSEEGVETSATFCTAVMESKARLTYNQVYAAAVEKDREMQERLQAHMTMLEDAFSLADLLGRKRSQRGSLDFDLPEAQFVFDAKGEVADIIARKSNRANNLIEEFMIAANEAVARFLTTRKRHLLYRVHEAPNMEKLEALKNFLLQTHLIELPESLHRAGPSRIGRAGQVNRGGRGSRQGFTRQDTTQKKAEVLPPSPQEFKAILQAARGTPQEYTVNKLLLRAMMQARYSPDNLGHFGLASTCYCHFTSPIRRYADLVVHRALKNALGVREDVSQECGGTLQEAFTLGDDGGKGTDAMPYGETESQAVSARPERTPLTSASSHEPPFKKKKMPKTQGPHEYQKPQEAQGSYDEYVRHRLEDIAEHINQTERSAMEAERETHKRLSALFLLNHVGEEFDGVVSGVTDFGIFVELTACLSEGMVRLSSLDDDYYHYLQDRQMLRGERTGRQFTVGLPVRVQLLDVSLQRFEVTLAILPEAGGNVAESENSTEGRKNRHLRGGLPARNTQGRKSGATDKPGKSVKKSRPQKPVSQRPKARKIDDKKGGSKKTGNKQAKNRKSGVKKS